MQLHVTIPYVMTKGTVPNSERFKVHKRTNFMKEARLLSSRIEIEVFQHMAWLPWQWWHTILEPFTSCINILIYRGSRSWYPLFWLSAAAHRAWATDWFHHDMSAGGGYTRGFAAGLEGAQWGGGEGAGQTHCRGGGRVSGTTLMRCLEETQCHNGIAIRRHLGLYMAK